MQFERGAASRQHDGAAFDARAAERECAGAGERHAEHGVTGGQPAALRDAHVRGFLKQLEAFERQMLDRAAIRARPDLVVALIPAAQRLRMSVCVVERLVKHQHSASR